jgi:hypothetical protein
MHTLQICVESTARHEHPVQIIRNTKQQSNATIQYSQYHPHTRKNYKIQKDNLPYFQSDSHASNSGSGQS